MFAPASNPFAVLNQMLAICQPLEITQFTHPMNYVWNRNEQDGQTAKQRITGSDPDIIEE